MKMRKLLALLTLLGITASCTNEQDVKITQGTQPGEIQIMFNGNGAQAEYPDTRAIATDVENQIDKLDVYVFASDTEKGTYYFVEKWSKGDADDTATKTFALQGAGVNRKASIFPTEYKGYPYLKLYCVANGEIYKNGDTPITLTALTADANGSVNNTAAASKSTEIEEASPLKITADDTPIATPLPMGGVATTTISSDYSLVTVEMVRRVARFDIVNDAATTNLTITKITPFNARTSHHFFADDNFATLLKYPEVDYTKLNNANNGTTPAAFYAFPTNKENEMQLLIEGNYSGVPVSYNVKIASTPEPTVAVPEPVAAFIDVKANNRYTLRIKDVREAGLTVLFDIEDWTLGGGMIVKPNNGSKPEVVKIQTGETPSFEENVEDDIIRINNDGTFTLTAQANGTTHANITPIDPAKEITWLTTDNDKADKTVILAENGMKQTQLTFTTTNTKTLAVAGQKALITLFNLAAPEDPEFKKTFIAALPEVEEATISWNTAAAENDYMNLIDNTDTANPVIYWYKTADNNTVSLKIDAYYDISTTITKVDNAGTFTLPTYTAGSKTLTITTNNMATDLSTTDGDFILTNLADDTKTTTVHIKYIPVEEVKATINNEKVTLTGNICEIDVDGMTEDGSDTYAFDLTISSSEGIILPVTVPGWLTIAEKTPFDKNTGETVYTVTVNKKAVNFDEGKAEFKQAIKDATPLNITFKKKEEIII